MKRTLLSLSLPLLIACGTTYVDHERASISGRDAGCSETSEEEAPPPCSVATIDVTTFNLGDTPFMTTSTVTFTVSNTELVDAELYFEQGTNLRLCDNTDEFAVFCIAPSTGAFATDSTLEVPAEDSVDLELRFMAIIPDTRDLGVATLFLRGATECSIDLRAEGRSLAP